MPIAICLHRCMASAPLDTGAAGFTLSAPGPDGFLADLPTEETRLVRALAVVCMAGIGPGPADAQERKCHRFAPWRHGSGLV
jgi:hypothetical protein